MGFFSCYILGTLEEFMAVTAMMYRWVSFLGFCSHWELFPLALVVVNLIDVVDCFRILSLIPSTARYEDVAADPKLFMSTLEKLHAAMGTKFMIPIIGGRELDLHRLFVEVTSRGGIEKIIRERRWKEVTAVFNFPSTATNASFVLRKYYASLLYHYEQIYYFKAHGWTTSAPDALQSLSPVPVPTQRTQPLQASPGFQSAVLQQSRVNDAEFPGGIFSLLEISLIAKIE